MADFFVSYNQADRNWAEWIAWQLEEAGYTTVIKAWDLRAGGNFVIAMHQAAAEAERTLIVLSPDYLAARFTQPEWAAAFARDPLGEKGTLLPVRVRPCDLLGLLPQIVCIDLTDKEEAQARADLLSGVRRERGKPHAPPSFPQRPPSARPVPSQPAFPGTQPEALTHTEYVRAIGGAMSFPGTQPEAVPDGKTDTLPAPPPAPGPLLGSTLGGKYQVVSLLGRGGMGQVYLGQRVDIGGRVAIKVLHPDLSRNPDIARRFYNEARAVNQIEHPGLVMVLDFGQLADGATYLVMEYLSGDSLGARLAQMPGGLGRDAVRLTWQMASILLAVHGKGIVHRDLKPDNVMLVPDPATPGTERVKILDFGIAKVAREHSQQGTRTGAILGTPAYMAPEQCREAGSVTDRADVYSLGVMFYQLLAGRPPFIGRDPMALMYKQVHEAPPPIRDVAPSVSKEVAVLVERMLAKEPEKRPAMGEVAEKLWQVLSVREAAPGAGTQRRTLLMGLAAGVLGSLTMVGMGLMLRFGCSSTLQVKAPPDARAVVTAPPDLRVPDAAVSPKPPPADLGGGKVPVFQPHKEERVPIFKRKAKGPGT